MAVTEAVEQTTMFLEPRRGLYGNQQSYIWLIELTPMSSKHFKQLTIETISQKKTNECRIFTDVGLVVFVAFLLCVVFTGP